MLIDAGIDLHFRDKYNFNCLHWAAIKRVQYEILELLIKNGADVNSIAKADKKTLNFMHFYFVLKLNYPPRDPKVYTLIVENGFNLRD